MAKVDELISGCKMPAALAGRVCSSYDSGSVAGDILIQPTGSGLQYASGTDTKLGSGTLVAGAVTVANTATTANSRVFVLSAAAAAPGNIYLAALSAGVSFQIASTGGAETGAVTYLILEQV